MKPFISYRSLLTNRPVSYKLVIIKYEIFTINAAETMTWNHVKGKIYKKKYEPDKTVFPSCYISNIYVAGKRRSKFQWPWYIIVTTTTEPFLSIAGLAFSVVLIYSIRSPHLG